MPKINFSETLDYLIANGHELRALECKGSASFTDNDFKAKIIKTCMSLANLRDGGRVIIGIRSDGNTLHEEGLTEEQRASWDYDQLCTELSSYCDPQITIDLTHHEVRGKKYILIEVEEFEEIPIMCKKNYPPNGTPSEMREAAFYIRTRQKPETSVITSHAQLRELVDLATSKAVARTLAHLPCRQPSATSGDDATQFEAELGRLR